MSSKANYLISLSNAGVKRNNHWLVRGVDLIVSPGELVTLIGPNGSGKSTTTKLALGILSLSEGVLKTNSNLKVGYLPQSINMDWTIPLKVSRFMRLTRSVSSIKIREALTLTGANHLQTEQIGNLSGGELQRVMLARSIVSEPNFLVLDEPTQSLDFYGESDVYDVIKTIRKERGIGILLVSHDLHMVMASTDQVICLNGHVCCSGTPSNVVSTKAYHDLFGDRGASALALYQHRHDHKHLSDGKILHIDEDLGVPSHPDDSHRYPEPNADNKSQNKTVKI